MLESERKGVECVFGILKKRWKVLKHGLKFRDIKVCEKIFVSCAVLHLLMLDETVRGDRGDPVPRGHPLAGDGMWIEGPADFMEEEGGIDSLTTLARQWGQRRKRLVYHHQYSAREAKRARREEASS